MFEPEFLSPDEELRLVASVEALPYAEVRMHGVVAKRRVAHYGWNYSFDTFRVSPGPPIPEFLLPVRERLAAFAGVVPADLVEALITEYRPGAAIGWHRDAPPFGIVAAVSLAGTCRMRFRRGKVRNWETTGIELPPRSAYAITGEARSHWQHHIPPTKELRYSITFRTLKKRSNDAEAQRHGDPR